MLSTKVFEQRLKDFETTYETCLKTLASLTSGNPSTEQLARFQPSLYHSLLQLTRGYHEIRRERERLVARKERLTKAWHHKRQRVLAERQQIRMRAIRLTRLRLRPSSMVMEKLGAGGRSEADPR